jgi:regulator of replication initiation timing
MELKYVNCSISQNYSEIEKKLKEEVHKLETENEDLRQKLDAVVTRNQVLSEEKAAICAKGSLDVKVLQEHSEKWRQL